MDKNRKYIFLLVASILLVGRILLAGDTYTEEYGIITGEKINRGFVFVDGRYLNTPYVISRKGLALYINDIMVEPLDLQITKKALSVETDYALWTEENRKKLSVKVEHLRAKYETELQEGHCYFFFTKGGHVSMDPYTVAYKLPKIIEELRSGKPIAEKLKRIYRLNWQLKIGDQRVNEFVANFSVTDNFETRLNQLAENLLRTEVFGTTVGKSVGKGFVFYNGRYIDVPYAVTRKGLGIFVNDILISQPTKWPPPILEEKDDPSLPEWIVRDSVFEDIRDHLIKKYRYLLSRYSEKETVTRYAEYIEKLPCVKDLKFTSEVSIEVTTFSGETWPLDLSASFVRRAQSVKQDRNSVLQRREAKRKYYENGLLRGDCFFIFDGGEVTLANSLLAKLLPNVVLVLRSSKSKREKFDELQKLNLPISEDSFPTLVTDFHASSQLEARLSELTKPK